MTITVICVIISGLTCFIAGMAVEFGVVSKTLKESRAELRNEKRKRIIAESLIKKEVIEINDNRIKTDNLFDPW